VTQKKQHTLYLPKDHFIASNEFFLKLSKFLNYKIENYQNLAKIISSATAGAIICSDDAKEKNLQIKTTRQLLASLEQMVVSFLVFPQPDSSNVLNLLNGVFMNNQQENKKPMFVYSPAEAGDLLEKLKPAYAFVGDLSSVNTENLPGIKATIQQAQENVVFNWDQKQSLNLSKSVPAKRISHGSIIGCDVRLFQNTKNGTTNSIEVLVGKTLCDVEFRENSVKTSDVLACLAVGYSLQKDSKETAKNVTEYLNTL